MDMMVLILLLTHLPSVYTTSPPRSSWSQGPNGKLYIDLHKPQQNKENSRQLCEAEGGHLPEPRDRNESTFLKKFEQKFYIGVNDKNTEGFWVFEDEYNSFVTWYDWIDWGTSQEPNGGVNENCASFWQYAGLAGWVDIPCTEHDTISTVVCEKSTDEDNEYKEHEHETHFVTDITGGLKPIPANHPSLVTGRTRQPSLQNCDNLDSEPDRLELYKHIGPFSDLTETEIRSVEAFLHKQRWLKLMRHDRAEVHSNFVHLVELLPPNKRAILRYIDEGGPTPRRKARAFIFRGNMSTPVIEEYKVWPLPNPNKISLMSTTSRKTSVPYSMRPFTKYEFKAIYRYVLPAIFKKAGQLIIESYNATLFNCKKRCLRFSMTPVSSAFLKPGQRKAWFWFAYDIEFYMIHPLDLQFLVDMSERDPKAWTLQKVFYANRLFTSIDDLLTQYKNHLINKTRMRFPDQPPEQQHSAAYMRGDPTPSEAIPPPQTVRPEKRRFGLTGNLLEYMDWKLNLRISPTVGLHLNDIRFKGERIVYELSMQEIGVLYSGHSPAASMLYFADSAGLFGTRMRGMMPGEDCPEHSLILDALVYTSNTDGLKRLENSVCIFEKSNDLPLRRHRAYSKSGAFYSALNDNVLIIRMYICMINYDYIFDYIFHNNGAIEVKVSSTGYVAASFWYPEEERFGTRISYTVIAGLHQHLFHFKADIDVKGTDNRFSSIDIGIENKTDSWADIPGSVHVQNFMKRVDKKTEKEAASHFNFDEPKYLLFSGGRKNNLGHVPSIRLIHKGMTKGLLPKGNGFEPSVSWARQQMAVTRHHDDEMTSSSMFAMWDARDPVVNFDRYITDDEDIVDKDLVAWVTMGMYHIPHTEDIPNTATVGSTQSFFLTPFNYFKEDPSLSSRDAVKVMPRDPRRPTGGATVERHGLSPSLSCYKKSIDKRLYHNSTFLFT